MEATSILSTEPVEMDSDVQGIDSAPSRGPQERIQGYAVRASEVTFRPGERIMSS